MICPSLDLIRSPILPTSTPPPPPAYHPHDGGSMHLETSVCFHETQRRYIPEDYHLLDYKLFLIWNNFTKREYDVSNATDLTE
jgi:hypothetical protein